jgi:hypothetical protein
VKAVKTYDTVLEAELARIRLRAEGIAATIVGVGVAMEGGGEGVRVLVPDDLAENARKILGAS